MKRLTKLVLIAGLTVLLFSSCGKDGGIPDPVTESDSTAVTTTVTETEEPVITEITTVTEITTETEAEIEELVIDPSMAELAKTDLRYEWIYAFLTGDTATCERIGIIDAGGYDDLKKLRFSNYSVTPMDDEYLKFSFTVTEGIDTLPAGEYVFKIGGRYEVYRDKNESEGTAISEYPDIIDYLDICWCGFTSKDDLLKYESDKVMWESMFYSVLQYYRSATGTEEGITAEEVRRGGKLMFGIEDFYVNETAADQEDGKYIPIAHGGFWAEYIIESVTENEDCVEYVLQYYADRMYLTKSHKITITLEKTGDPVYEWRVKDVKRLSEGKFPPAIFMR